MRDAHADAVRVLGTEGASRGPSLDEAFPDRRVELLFVCAHPAIDASMHAPLMLQTVLGLTAARIAQAPPPPATAPWTPTSPTGPCAPTCCASWAEKRKRSAPTAARSASNLTDVTADAANVRPAEHANNALWVLGHILFWRNRVLEKLGANPLWPEADSLEFREVKLGPPPASVGADFTFIVERLAATTPALAAALEREVPDEVGREVQTLALHEAYHVGQLGMLRRSMGLAGALGEA